jgi:uncharacterized protein YdhG (YjbR/CyaY superfamily)
MITKKPSNIDEYISAFPFEVQEKLEIVRKIIEKAVPDATEVISYSMPAFKHHGLLVWFAAHTNHIGFYPKASGIEVFKEELSVYKHAKGSVQFPFSKPLPVDLITRIVKFRAEENLHKSKKNK